MSYRIEKNYVSGIPELVIAGFEQGIADSPHLGIADIRNMNIISAPKQASVMFKNAAMTLPPSGHTGVAFSAAAATDVITVASTAGFYTGMAVTIVTVSGAGGLTAGRTYYMNNITATTFKLYPNYGADYPLDITADITGTYTIYTFGTPTDSVSISTNTFQTGAGENIREAYVLTSDGLVWHVITQGTLKNTLQFSGNVLHSSAGSPNFGIVAFNNYLMVFQNAKIDYLPLTTITPGSTGNPSALWVYGWQDITVSQNGHRAIATTDDAVYFCNGNKIGSITVTVNSTFDPTTATTYGYNASALDIFPEDRATCIAQLGTNLLIGGVNNFIYPWDRVSPSFTYPLVVAEKFAYCIVSTNSNAYIFSGSRGTIYITNGANVEVFKKFPDSLSGVVEPYYTWNWAIYRKNQLYFTLSATNNAGTAISNFAGIWALDLKNGALRLSNSLSHGSYAGTVPTLCPMGSPRPTGDGILSFWLNTTGGADYTASTPYTNYEARIDTDIIPVGTFIDPNTFGSIEFKLTKPLVSGEAIKISQRSNLTDAFTEIGSCSTVGLISDSFINNFENVQWLQLRIEMSSTDTTPSYCPLLEIRLRK